MKILKSHEGVHIVEVNHLELAYLQDRVELYEWEQASIADYLTYEKEMEKQYLNNDDDNLGDC